MTFSTSRDWNVRLQTSQRCGFGDVDMTRRALRDVLFLLAAAFVYELRRDSRRIGQHVRCFRQLVTAIAVRRDWFLRFPVAVETRRMIFGCCLDRRGPRSVTDRAVVIVLLRRMCERHGDYVLVLVVRKLDIELQLRRRVSKRETSIVARRRLRVTHRTDRRACAFEKLRPVTAHTRVMAGIIVDVGKRDFVAAIASGPVFRRGVRELRVIDR